MKGTTMRGMRGIRRRGMNERDKEGNERDEEGNERDEEGDERDKEEGVS